jgi:hypothetical protein
MSDLRKHLLPREYQLHRPSDMPRRDCRQSWMRPRISLAAKSATHEW